MHLYRMRCIWDLKIQYNYIYVNYGNKMKLAFKKFGSGKPLFILHGLFGSSDNWQTLGKKFAESYTVYLIDARNHGHSAHSQEFSYELMSDDLLELMNDENLEKANLLG